MKQPDDDATLSALAERARAEQGDALSDQRWEAVAAGRASESDRSALERAAKEDGLDPAEVRALFEPLGSSARQRALDLALSELGADPQAPGVASGAGDAAAAGKETAKVSWLPRAFGAFTAVALAAAIAFYVTRPAAVPDTAVAALPGYELSISGGTADTRGDPQERIVLTRGSNLTLTMRPATRVTGALEARAFIVQGASVHPLPLEAAITAEGAVRLHGKLAELPGAPGPAEIVVTVVRPGLAHDPLAVPAQGAQRVSQPVQLGKSE